MCIRDRNNHNWITIFKISFHYKYMVCTSPLLHCNWSGIRYAKPQLVDIRFAFQGCQTCGALKIIKFPWTTLHIYVIIRYINKSSIWECLLNNDIVFLPLRKAVRTDYELFDGGLGLVWTCVRNINTLSCLIDCESSFSTVAFSVVRYQNNAKFKSYRMFLNVYWSLWWHKLICFTPSSSGKPDCLCISGNGY